MSYDYYGYDYSDAASTGAGIGVGMLIFYLVIAALMLVSMWKIFVKCGKPGWACLIPIYNIIVMLEIAEKPAWYVLLFFVPFANIYAMWVCYDGMARKLGKSSGFTVGMIFLPVIFIPILAFSKSSTAEVSAAPVSEPAPINDVSEPTQAPVAETVNSEPAPTNDFVSAPVSEPAPTVEQPSTVDPVSSAMDNSFNTEMPSEAVPTPSVDVADSTNNDTNENGQM